MTSPPPGSPDAAPVLEARDVAVSLSGRPIVRDVDLTVRRGEVVALMGANGSGKSTLVKALLGLVPAGHGEVLLFGSPQREFHQWARLGFVPQRSTIATGVPSTVREVVSSGRLAHRRPLLPPTARDRDAVRSAIEAVGLTDRTRHTVATLSGGQQQRVLIARALAGDPELLVLDEPNAGVDLVSQDAIAQTLAARAAAGGTLLVVLHELGPFADLIDRMVVLREGRLVYDGLPRPGVFHDHGHHHLDDEPLPARPEVQAPLDSSEESR